MTDQDIPASDDREYDLADWSVEARDALGFLAEEAAIPHAWRTTTLVVPRDRGAAIDEQIAYLSSGVSPAGPSAHGAGGPSSPSGVAAGWYADPWGLGPWRWWDGAEWTGWASSSFMESPGRGRRWFPSRRERDTTGGIRGGGIAIVGFVASIAAAIAVGLGVDALGASDTPVNVALLASQAALWSALLAACIVASRRHGDGSLRSLGLRITWRDCWIGPVAGLAARVASIVVVIPFVPLLDDDRAQPNSFVESGSGGNTVAILAVVAVVVIGAPFFEELFFRGLVQGVLTRRWGAWVAVWVQAVLFTALHLYPGMSTAQLVITLLVIGTAGLFLGAIRYHFDRLGPGMIAHGVFNAIALAVFFAVD